LNDNGQPDISADPNNISITDTSNYDTNTEAGHTQAEFTYRKLIIACPNGTSIILSTLDGTTIAAAGATLPITDKIPYSTGDGHYTATLITMPQYDSTINYNTNTNPCVLYNGVIYSCILTGTGQQPDISPTYWTPIQEINLSAKYKQSADFIILCRTIECYQRQVIRLVDNIHCVACNEDIAKNKDYQYATNLLFIIESFMPLLKKKAYQKIGQNIELAKEICKCCNSHNQHEYTDKKCEK
jgi:hypothetical protein